MRCEGQVPSLWLPKQRGSLETQPSGTSSAECFSESILAAVSARVIHYFSYLLCSDSYCPMNTSLEYWKFLPFKLESIYGGPPYMSLILHPFNGISYMNHLFEWNMDKDYMCAYIYIYTQSHNKEYLKDFL